MKVFKNLSYSFLVTINLFLSCSTEVENLDASQLYGHWEIKSAQRNGKPTETLINTFFDFNKEGKMITNFSFNGNEVFGDFEIDGRNIIQKGKPDVNYSVEILEKDKLVLFTNLMDHKFTLNLEKKN